MNDQPQTPKFLQQPFRVISDARLVRSDLFVYSVIRWFAQLRQKKCFASNETLAALTGLPISTVRRSLRKLERCGHIACKYRNETKRHRLEIAVLGEVADAHIENAGSPSAPAAMDANEQPDERGRAQRKSIYIDNKEDKEERASPGALLDTNQVNMVLAKFGLVNELYLAGPYKPTQRRAMERLLGRHTAEEVLAMITYTAAHRGEEFFPTVLSPIQLEEKWSLLEDKRKVKRQPAQKGGNLLPTSNPNKYAHISITK